MDEAQEYPPTLYEVGVFSAVLTLVAMGVLYWQFSGPGNPDWDGYGRLFDDQGGWLLRQGQSPAFVWLLQTARDVLGSNGYDTFRAALFGLFMAFAAWLAHAMPAQEGFGRASCLLTATIVVAAFLLKGLVQVREGLAFLFILIPVQAMYGHRRRGGLLGSGIGAMISGAIHSGTVLFLGNWLASASLWVLPSRALTGWAIQNILLFLAVAIGVALALTVLHNATTVSFLLEGFGVDQSADAKGGLWKYVYWLAYGVTVLVVRHQVVLAASGTLRFPYAYATTLASFVLPLTYAVCLALVFTHFYIPAFTSMAIRFLFTCLELALIIIALRGRANLVTLAIALASIADQSRLLIQRV